MFRSNKASAAKRTMLIAAVAASVLALAGCGASSSPKAADDPAESGTLDWWGFTPNKTVAESLIAEFNKEYPDITVNYKFYPAPGDYPAALRAGLASNSGPDLFNLSTNTAAPVSQFGSFAVDLAPALGEDGMAKISDLAKESFTLDDGSLAAVALGYVSAGGMYVNKDILDEHGLTPPTTLDEWKDACETLEAAGVQCFAIGAGTNAGFNIDTLHAIANSLHPGKWQETSTGDGSWDDDWFVETLEAWKELQTVGIIPEGAIGLQQYPDANNAFMQQKAAMVQMGTWYNGNLIPENMTRAIEGAGVADATPFTLLPVPFPDMTNKGNEGAMFSDVDSAVAVNKKSDSINAATTFAVAVDLRGGTAASGEPTRTDGRLRSTAGLLPDRTGQRRGSAAGDRGVRCNGLREHGRRSLSPPLASSHRNAAKHLRERVGRDRHPGRRGGRSPKRRRRRVTHSTHPLPR
jgi:ABC-type glycerol-3-phosphate transport system substrate-binding protein